ncbi:hypothetical protein TVAG_438410 [Trichomonas vaginalis G3]|uniref:Uncharacterized protein n=1 Tax=Trichomonas vaginalis (strain ATCC PRA-98 / G3) TaxID=412133 RepID=A2EYN7_TRIV3|nr:hypothetical protein TVAGG3_0672130 [Trichomonas vaginalis G3]EAY02250.1 hypothetical protein TVAG_438410 [Trichomonas vaginalis G3]KAI5507278.1 hypothetical protein TVAGG3_0672130 [Trichomonas vaginalis G3]|eukprot:XP_001330609.1 hypothetical protein [Trichomonas vaginalis G3]
METKFDFQINSESKLSIFNSYFINCNVESLDVDIIRDCYFKNSTIVSITGRIETVFTDNATSVINCSFTQEIPYPEVEPILCPSIPLEKNYTNHEQNSSIRFTFIDEKIEVTNCKFIKVSVQHDEGSAITILRPAYQYFVSDPFIKIDNVFFWKCQSELISGAIYIDYSSSHIEMSHICGIEISGMMFQFCYIDTKSYFSFNSSTIYSDFKSANALSYDVYDINGLFYYGNRITTIINGINTSKCYTIGSVFNLHNSTIKFCQEEAIYTAFFTAYVFVDVDYYNFINSSTVNQSLFIENSDYNSNVTFSHCVFIDSPLIEFFKDYADTNNISFIDCNSTKLNNLESYLLPACRTPNFNSKNYKMIIYYSVSAALFVLVVAIVCIAYYWSRKKNANFEKRLELDRELAGDFG